MPVGIDLFVGRCIEGVQLATAAAPVTYPPQLTRRQPPKRLGVGACSGFGRFRSERVFRNEFPYLGRVESGEPVIAAVIIEPEGEPKKILRVTLPLGMQLVHGTRIIVDANAPQQSPYVICFQNGCMSDYEATPELIGNLKKGQNLVVQAINSNGAPLTLPLPLAGEFAKAYDGPPTDPKVFEENQKKLQEELQKRAEDARKKLEANPPAGAPANPAAK